MQRARTAARRSSSRPTAAARFAPCWHLYVLQSEVRHCDCTTAQNPVVSAVIGAAHRAGGPELLLLEAKWSSLVSYGLSLDASRTFCHLKSHSGRQTLCGMTRSRCQATGSGSWERPPGFRDGSPSNWVLLPQPEGAFTVGIDGGYVRHWCDKQQNFEAMVGKSVRTWRDEDAKSPSPKRLGCVQNAGYPHPSDVCMRCCSRKACR